MCKVVEEVAERYAQRKCERLQTEFAQKMIKRGTYSLEEVAECLDMPIETVEDIAKEMESEQPKKTDH